MRATTLRRVLVGPLLAAVLTLTHAASQDPIPDSMTSEIVRSFPEIVTGPKLRPRPHWPVWLKDYRRSVRTNESSAIEYLGRERGARVFLIADDTGEFHVARVSQQSDTGRVELELEPVKYGRSLIDGLEDYPKWDFEALAVSMPRPRGDFDANVMERVEILLSIEGRDKKRFREETSIVSIRLTPGAQRAWTMDMTGEALAHSDFFRRHAKPNRGIEGLAIGGQRLFLGLGELSDRGEISSQGTLLFVLDRSKNHYALVPTREISIRSICGLDAVGDTISVLIDRDRMEVVVLRWDGAMTGVLHASQRFPVDLPAPDGLRYSVPSVEGLAIDDDGDFWLVTDPWAGHYRPIGEAPETLHVYLEARMPMMYRIDGGPAWAALGLEHLWPDDSPPARRTE